MKVSRENKKAEAIKRMKALDVYTEAIKQFKNEDIIMVSEPPLGGLYWLNKEEKKIVADFELEYNALVYMVVRSNTEFGLLDSLLYVSDEQEEWEMDWEDIPDRYLMSYVVNRDCPDYSEFGSIAVKSVGGGLVRIG
jgi:hypothetical protein